MLQLLLNAEATHSTVQKSAKWKGFSVVLILSTLFTPFKVTSVAVRQ